MLVTVIIPVYNVEGYIIDCYRSVKSQSYKPLEIIFVDNNSTDNSTKILREISESDHEVTVLSELRPGAAAARNKGLEIAKGDYIQFLDADDLLDECKIELQMTLVHKDAYPDIVFGAYKKRSIDGKEFRVNLSAATDDWENLMRTRLGITSSNLWKTAAVRACNGWDENLTSSQEYDLMFRILKSGGKGMYDNYPATIVRDRPSGRISSGDPKRKWANYCMLRMNVLQHIGNVTKTVPHQYYQAAFDSLRLLYRHDRKQAKQLFQENIPAVFQPRYAGTSGSLYAVLFRVCGFDFTEQLFAIVKTLSHSQYKSLD